MVKLEVIVSTMNKADDDFSLVEKMNIQTDAIIINQSDHVAYNELAIRDKTIKLYTFNERGVGLSRNNGLMRSTADICLMADDDMVYAEGYEKRVLEAYQKNPSAEFIIFNVRVYSGDKISEMVKKNRKLKYWERFGYGTVSFSFKRQVITKHNIAFSLLFGGGARYGSGEDTLFLWDSLKNNIRVYTDNFLLAEVYNNNSSWFKGYDEQYYFDKGALYKSLSPRFNLVFNFYILLRTIKDYKGEKGVKDLLRIINEGANNFSELS